MKITEYSKSLKIATYNLQFSLDSRQIVHNIHLMAENEIVVFCLQEVLRLPNKTFILDLILKDLGANWKVVYHIGEEKSRLGIGTCILWNNKILQPQKTEKFLLPRKHTIAFHEWMFAKLTGGEITPYPRRAIVGYFHFSNTTVRISNIHLDHTGGLKHRQKQLLYFLDKLKDATGISHEIVCGDFNTFDLLKTGKEISILRKLFGSEFKNASKDVSWTADLNKMEITKEHSLFKAFIKVLNIHIRQKLDYIWVKDFHVINCWKVEVLGSDHFPVIAHIY